MSVYFDEEKGRWRFDFQRSKKRYQGYCVHPVSRVEARNKTQAREIEATIKEKLKAPALQAVVPGCTMSQAIAYFSKHQGQHLAEWKTMKSRLREILDFFGRDADVCTATEERLAEYVSWMRKQTIKTYVGGPGKRGANDDRPWKDTGRLRSIRTINDYLQLVLRVLSVPPAKKWVPVLPEVKFLQEPKRMPSPIEQRAGEKILSTAAPHLRRLVTICNNTGMRETEALTVRARQVHETMKVILLEENTKSRKGAPVYLNDEAWDAIAEALRDGDALWARLQADAALAASYASKWGIVERGDIPVILYRDKPIRRVKSAWRGAKARGGVKGRIRFHDTRATFCSDLARNGVDPHRIKELARHADIETTMLYVKAADQGMHEAVALLGKSKTAGAKVPPESPSRADHLDGYGDDKVLIKLASSA